MLLTLSFILIYMKYTYFMNYHTIFAYLCLCHSQGSHPLFPHHPHLTFLVESVWRILEHEIVYDAFLTCAPTVLIFPVYEK